MSEFHAIIHVEELQDYINTLQSLVSEATFHFTDDGIYTNPVDPANVAVINQTLKPPAFEDYQTDGFRIGINLERFQDFLDAGDDEDLVELDLDPETRRINITLPDAEFSMAGIDPDSVRDGTDIEDMSASEDAKYTTNVVMDAAALKHSLSVVDKVTDHLKVTMDPSRDSPLHFVGEGDTDDARVRFGNSLKEGSKVGEVAESYFSLEYMDALQDPIPKAVPIRVEFGQEWPTRWSFSSMDGHRDVKILCSPRVVRN